MRYRYLLGVAAGFAVLGARAVACNVMYSTDFNSFTLGDLNGQDGWFSILSGPEAGVQVVDLGGGDKAVRLDVADVYNARALAAVNMPDVFHLGHVLSVEAKYDLFRMDVPSGKNPENCYFAMKGDNPDMGGQWDMDHETYPFLWDSGHAPTVLGRFATLDIQYDLVNHTRTAYYDGNLVVSEPTDTSTFNGFDGYWVSLYHQALVGPTTMAQYAMIDNMCLTAEYIPAPEPSTIAFLALGALALVRRRR